VTTVEHVPDSADLVRHCNAIQVDRGIVSGAAFVRRADEPDLSVVWLDRVAGSTEDERLRGCVPLLGRTVRASHWLAMLSAGEVRAVQAFPMLDVLHQPLPSNDAHCGISNIPAGSPDSPHSVCMALADAVRRCVSKLEMDRS
jgi:hypothetical protein